MRWWQFSSSSSSSSSKQHSQDDSEIRYTAPRLSLFSARRIRHNARKLRSPSQSTASSSSPSPSPHPLPLPELHVLLRQDPKFAKYNVPLPSPSTQFGRVDDRGERDTMTEAIERLKGIKSKSSGLDTETRSSRKSLQKQNTKNKYKISIPTSAPTTPYSSPVPSPPSSDMRVTRFITPRGAFEAWSAPELPPSDGRGSFLYRWSSEQNASSIDSSSPIQSPSSSELLNPRMSCETPLGRRESNAQATVHPLPLPPVAAVASQSTPLSPLCDCQGASIPLGSTPIPSDAAKPEFPGAHMLSQQASGSAVSNKPDLLPMNSQWQKGKLIGRGTFGSVYVASNRQNGALCAMKEVEILPDDSKSAECIRQLEQEIKILSRLKHPNIVQYYGSEIVGDKFYIYLEYVHPGSINRFIQDHCGAITESVVRNFTRHILCGLAYLHRKKTIHRDIKGANLLVDAYGVVKLADFGTSKHLTGQFTDLSLKGSPYWLAPELLQSTMQKDASSDQALAVDIWSLGCTIIEMMNGKPPWSEYEGAAALFKVLHESPSIPEALSADGKDFLECCLCRNPADRPTAGKLLDHPFVNHSLQPDASTKPLKERRSVEKPQLSERRNHKLDHGPASCEIDVKKGKLVNKETTQQGPHQVSRIAVPPFPSPRSTLEAFPTLSPLSSGSNPDCPITPSYNHMGC